VAKSNRSSRRRARSSKAAATTLLAADRWTTTVVLVLFAAVFVALGVASYSKASATWDEPFHLAAGYAALARHDYRVDPEHPPFQRMWAALPLLVMGDVTLDTAPIDRASPSAWVAGQLYGFSQRFLYVANDADRLLSAARFMTLLLGTALGVLVFSWTHEWLGFRPAVAVLCLYTIEPNLAAHASLVTTDFGIACFMFGAVYFLWRTCRQPSSGNLAGLVILVALAAVSKFTAVVLAPIFAILLAHAVFRQRTLTAIQGTGIATLLAGATWLAIWATYGFRYAPSASPGWLFHLQYDAIVQARVPGLAALSAWVDDHHLLPNAFTQGFLIGQAKAQLRPAFFAGSYSATGWWYYFPAAIALKTPLTVLACVVAGLGTLAAAQRDEEGMVAFVVCPIVVILGAAMLTHINIGLRHVLPIYPFMLLCAAAAVRALLDRGRIAVVAIGIAVALVEFGSTYPYTLAFFNQLVGGPSNGWRYLADSNLDWGQDLKRLKRWMQANSVARVNLAYFGLADPAYYRIAGPRLPAAPDVLSTRFDQPQLPGYVAVSVTELLGVYFDEQRRDLYAPLRDREPVADIGHSIRVYWVDKPWW
jgi:hypothetical protein